MRLFIIAAAAASAFAVPAAAQSSFDPQISVSAGYARYVDGSEDWDGHTATGRITARLHRYFGVEGDFALGLGSSDIAGVDVSMNSNVAGYVVAYWPVDPNLDLTARVGYGSTELEFDFGGGTTVTESFDGMAFGIGAQYYFDEHNGVRFDVTRHEYNDIDGGLDSVGITYVRRF